MKAATECTGTWREVHMPPQAETETSVLRCTGCGDWMVFFPEFRAHKDVSAEQAPRVADAVLVAFAELIEDRKSKVAR